MLCVCVSVLYVLPDIYKKNEYIRGFHMVARALCIYQTLWRCWDAADDAAKVFLVYARGAFDLALM